MNAPHAPHTEATLVVVLMLRDPANDLLGRATLRLLGVPHDVLARGGQAELALAADQVLQFLRCLPEFEAGWVGDELWITQT